jgi:hypothetical protein
MMRLVRAFTAIVSIALVSAPLAALAQQVAPPAAGPAPSYAKPANLNGEETIMGRVNMYDGKYSLQVRDDRGFIDNVELHQGTIINPTGLRLQPGMTVTILGYNRGRAFAANEIDTPYQAYGYAAYPYPVYPAFSLGFGFGPEYYHHWH